MKNWRRFTNWHSNGITVIFLRKTVHPVVGNDIIVILVQNLLNVNSQFKSYQQKSRLTDCQCDTVSTSNNLHLATNNEKVKLHWLTSTRWGVSRPAISSIGWDLVVECCTLLSSLYLWLAIIHFTIPQAFISEYALLLIPYFISLLCFDKA